MAASRTFGSTNDVINCGSDSSLDNLWASGASLSIWAYPTQVGGGQSDPRLITKSESATDSWSFLFQDNPSGVLEFRSDFSITEGKWRSSSSEVTLNEWQHLALTYDGSSSSNDPIIYNNGSSVSISETTTPDGTIAELTTNPVRIGNYHAGTREFDGDLAYACIWNRILSPEEIVEQMYNPGAFVDGLVLFVPIWGTSTEPDLSGTGNDGTVTGTSTSTNGPPVYFPQMIC